MKYAFFAVFEKETEKMENGKIIKGDKEEELGYNVRFPDFDDLYTCGSTLEEAIYMAKDVLEGYLLILEEDTEYIPQATSYEHLIHYLNEDTYIQLIIVDTDLVRFRESYKSVNKTVTLPKYLLEAGKEYNLNFSAILQSALREKLGEKLKEPIEN